MDGLLFPVVVVVFCILAIVVFAANAVNFNIIRNGTTTVGRLTPGQANTLFWVNIVFIILTVALGVWAIVALLRRYPTPLLAPTLYTQPQLPFGYYENPQINPSVPLCSYA